MLSFKVMARQKQRPLEIISTFWSWFFLALLFSFFSIAGTGFFTFDNIQDILTNAAFALLVALGQTVVIISGGFDLSAGYCMGLSSVVTALMIGMLGRVMPLPVAILLAVLIGILVGTLPGLLNGMIIAYLSVPPFIVTLGMYGILHGANFLIAQQSSVPVEQDLVRFLGNNYLLYILPNGQISFFAPPQGIPLRIMREMVGGLQLQLAVSIILVLICSWLLTQTRFGRHTYALGGNREAARRAGIPVARHTIRVYLFSAFISAIAGVLFMFRFSSGQGSAGDALVLGSVAAVAIGGASLFGGAGTVVGTLIGTLIIAVIENGLVITHLDPNLQYVAVGIIIVMAVFVDQLRARVAR